MLRVMTADLKGHFCCFMNRLLYFLLPLNINELVLIMDLSKHNEAISVPEFIIE
jgi:hypothetical protein